MGFAGEALKGAAFAVGSAAVQAVGTLLFGRGKLAGSCPASCAPGPSLGGLALPGARRASLGRIWVHPKGTREWFGPYTNTRWNNILTFARIGSTHGHPREVWVGTREPQQRVRIYKEGSRTFPKKVTPEHRAEERRRFTGRSKFSRT